MKLHFNIAFFPGVLLASLLLIVSALPNNGLVYPQLINSSHAFVFFFANLFLLKLFLGVSKTYRDILTISLFSIFIGFLIEYIQPYIGRDRSALDFYYDVIGVLFSAIFYIRAATKPQKPSVYLLLLFLLLATAFPAFRVYLWWQINNTPTLLNFERDWEASVLTKDIDVTIEKTPSKAPFNKDGHVGKVNFGMTGPYSGFGLGQPRGNWTDFSELSWQIVSFNEHPISLNLRIHDAFHNQEYNDRFNYKFTVVPGLNSFSLALSEIRNGPEFRQIDLEKINNMKFFVVNPNEAITLYFDNVELR